MKLAVVILNWNGKAHLEKYLPYVLKYTPLDCCEVVIADNGSNDDSIEFLKKNYQQFKLIQLDENYGFAGGYNLALQQVEADYYCLLNSDVRVTEGWTDSIFDLFKQDSTVAAIQPKIRSDRDPSMFEHAGAAGGFVDVYGYPFCRGRIMNSIEKDEGQYNEQTEIFWASGACLFIRAEIFNNNNGFDGDYFAHMEEIDLCWRIKNQGYKIMYCPQSVIFHWGGATLDYNNPRKLYLNFRNSLWTLYKNYTGRNFWLVRKKRMIIDGFAVVKFAITFDFKNMLAVIKAHTAYYQSKRIIKQKRNALKQKVVITSHPQMLMRSIVWQFFIFNRKRFSEIISLKK